MRWRMNSRLTKIGHSMRKVKALCSKGVPCLFFMRNLISPDTVAKASSGITRSLPVETRAARTTRLSSPMWSISSNVMSDLNTASDTASPPVVQEPAYRGVNVYFLGSRLAVGERPVKEGLYLQHFRAQHEPLVRAQGKYQGAVPAGHVHVPVACRLRAAEAGYLCEEVPGEDRKSAGLDSSHPSVSYAVLC